MAFVFSVIYLALLVLMISLVASVVISWLRMFSPDWRPSGVLLVVLEAVLSVSDPVLRPARRLIPPLRFGGIGIDVSFIIVFFLVSILMQFFYALAVGG